MKGLIFAAYIISYATSTKYGTWLTSGLHESSLKILVVSDKNDILTTLKKKIQ